MEESAHCQSIGDWFTDQVAAQYPVFDSVMASVYDIAAVKVVDCSYCGRSAGQRCLNNSGRESDSCHWPRKAALQAWKRKGNGDRYRLLIKGEEYGMSEC